MPNWISGCLIGREKQYSGVMIKWRDVNKHQREEKLKENIKGKKSTNKWTIKLRRESSAHGIDE